MTSTRNGDWFVTFTGRRFYPFDARLEDIDIVDIAHSLSLQTRWMGHCKTFYSIASHSLACARVAEQQGLAHMQRENNPGISSDDMDVMRWCLMHDASEAYVGDIIRPIKRSLVVVEGKLFEPNTVLEPFKAYEDTLHRLIAERFGLPWPIPEAVHEIDNRMLVTEAKYLTNYPSAEHWIHEKNWAHIKPYAGDHVLLYQTMELAEEKFLVLAQEYLGL